MYDKTDNRNYNISQIIIKYLVKHNLIDWSSFEILEISENDKRNIRNNYKSKHKDLLKKQELNEILVSTQTFADFYINSTNGKRLKEYENSSLHIENE